MRSNSFMRYLLPAALGVLFCQTAAANGLALIHCNVFDGVENGIREDATVLVSGGRIERIADGGAAVPAGYESIDCAGHYLAPGLIDVHTHLDNAEAMKARARLGHDHGAQRQRAGLPGRRPARTGARRRACRAPTWWPPACT
jgi:imidazolonepropionase-like amidohydrolase